jgi:predicted HTH transcriptional regulator
MTDAELAELLELGRERPDLEFKAPGAWSDLQFRARVIRATLALSNTRDGGRVVLGIVENDDGTYTPTGLTSAQLATYREETVQDGVSEYVAPYVSLTCEVRQYNGADYVVVTVQEFSQIPNICKKDYQKILQRGLVYVRSRTRRPESVPVSVESDMRDLIDLAVDKGIRRMRDRGYSVEGVPSVRERYEQEIRDLLQ